MQIHVHTDESINNDQRLTEYVTDLTQSNLEHFSKFITTVNVHMSDENSHKGGANDKKCTIEVRIEKLKPIAVSHNSETLEEALTGALDKTHRSLKKVKEKNFNH
ncbi:MAG TPA: HPF/RaiA family ribosome-associated protein [Oligoflexia bacterium]|nr:HPF/RaiA family ribosome-associated protein [Oligoflexia bacterium]HMR24663.1 HPF/RaiA family ribosome-associated protein [Oligoflexia bacterium]